MIKDLRLWSFSNYLEFIGFRKESLYDPDFLKKFFVTGKEYEEFVLDYAVELPMGLERYFLK